MMLIGCFVYFFVARIVYEHVGECQYLFPPYVSILAGLFWPIVLIVGLIANACE